MNPHHMPGTMEIRVKGHLDESWSESFEGMTIANLEDGTAVLSGSLIDQAALQGMLRRIRDLGLPLVSVNQV
jgi:hypothetical protein